MGCYRNPWDSAAFYYGMMRDPRWDLVGCREIPLFVSGGIPHCISLALAGCHRHGNSRQNYRGTPTPEGARVRVRVRVIIIAGTGRITRELVEIRVNLWKRAATKTRDKEGFARVSRGHTRARGSSRKLVGANFWDFTGTHRHANDLVVPCGKRVTWDPVLHSIHGFHEMLQLLKIHELNYVVNSQKEYR